MTTTSFAQRQLEKYGWAKGDGLGKEKKGISKAIGISVKDDTNGVCVCSSFNHRFEALISTSSVFHLLFQLGAKADEWSNQWWDHCFNKATANIKIEATNDRIEIKKATMPEAAKKERSLLYGAFVKSGYFFLLIAYS